VMVGAAPAVNAALTADGWSTRASGFVGLHTDAAVGLFQQLRPTMGSVAVVELGANDCCDGGALGYQIDRAMQALSGLHVIWLTMPVFRPGAAALNQAIWAAAQRWPNLAIADWGAVVAANPGATWSDGLHLTASGDQLMASFLREQLDGWYGRWAGPSTTYVAGFGGAPNLNATGSPNPGAVSGATAYSDSGYWVTDSQGDVTTFGNAPFLRAASPDHPAAPIVGMASTPDRKGLLAGRC